MMNTGLERLQIADIMLRFFSERDGDLPPKHVSVSSEPVGHPEIHETRKILMIAPAVFLPRISNMPSRFKIEMHTKKGNRAGNTLEIKSSKPLAAPSMEEELNSISAATSIMVTTINKCLIANDMFPVLLL